MAEVDAAKHSLVPKHVKLSEKEKSEVLQKYNISVFELPRIFRSDPAVKNLELKEGDVVKILRKSLTAGESVFYRRIING